MARIDIGPSGLEISGCKADGEHELALSVPDANTPTVATLQVFDALGTQVGSTMTATVTTGSVVWDLTPWLVGRAIGTYRHAIILDGVTWLQGQLTVGSVSDGRGTSRGHTSATITVSASTGAVTVTIPGTAAAQALVDAEATIRAAADTALDGRLDAIEADYSTSTELATAVSNHAAASDPHGDRSYAAGLVSTEVGTRASADSALDSRLDAIEGLGSLATTAFVRTAINDSGVAATRPLLDILTQGLDIDASILVLGDSTGDEASEWVRQLATYLAGQFPAWTVRSRAWNDSTPAYDSPSIVQTGTGSRTLDIYNGSVGGWSTNNVQQRFSALAGAIRPTVCIISLGHNEALARTSAAPVNGSDFAERYLSVTEALTAASPQTSVICIAQNPTRINNRQFHRAVAIRDICVRRGFGFIDIHSLFLATPSWDSTLMADDVHPNAAGQTVWANAVNAAFNPGAPRVQSLQTPSSFFTMATSLALNPLFSSWTGSTPDSWSIYNATTSKDTTNYETAAQALKGVATPAGLSFAYQDIPARLVAGRWLTLAVRVRRNVTGANIEHGRIGFQEQGGAGSDLTSRAINIDGEYYWTILSNYCASNCTGARVRLYFSTGAGSAAAGDVSFDRVILVPGLLPADQLIP